jgi:hypothetical protein
MLAFESDADTARTDTAEDRLEALGRALFAPTGSNGVHARTALFETAIEALSTLITAHREADTEVLRFAPVMSRHQVEKSGYLHGFPHLLGCVCGRRKSMPPSGASTAARIGPTRCARPISC